MPCLAGMWRARLALDARRRGVSLDALHGMCFGIPESPRWLISRKGDRAAGLEVLQLIEPELPPAKIAAHAEEILAASSEQKTAARFWTWSLRIPIMLAFLIAFFNQLSGINAILYFAPRIFEMTGLGKQAALLQSVGIGITNLIFTFVGLWLIDRLGRRTLLYIGSFGYIASLGLWAFSFLHRAPQFKVASTASALIEMAPEGRESRGRYPTQGRSGVRRHQSRPRASLRRRTVHTRPGSHPRTGRPGRSQVHRGAGVDQSVRSRRVGRPDGDALHLCVYRGARHRPGHGHLGSHFRDLPEPASRRGPGAGQLHALGFRGAADDVLPEDGHGVPARATSSCSSAA